MSRERAEQLRQYLVGLTPKERIAEIIRLKAIDRQVGGSLSTEEDEFLNYAAMDFFQPTKKNAQGKSVVDMDQFMENMNSLSDLIAESSLECGEEIARWKHYFDNKKPESIEKVGCNTVAHNMELAKSYAMSTSFGSMKMTAFQDMIYAIGENALKTLRKNWMSMLQQNPELKNQFEREAGCSYDEFSTMPYIHAVQTMEDFMKLQQQKKRPENERVLISEGWDAIHTQFVSAKKLKEADPSDLTDFIATKKLLDQPIMNRSRKERFENIVEDKIYSGLGQYLNGNKDQILKTVENTLKAYENMKRDYNSVLFNTGSYNQMRASIRALRQKMNEIGAVDNNGQPRQLNYDQADDLITLLDDVSKNTTKYICDHVERRSTKNGEGRFKGALAILGAVDYDKAALVSYTANKIRLESPKADKQIVDLDRILAEQHIAPGRKLGGLKLFADYRDIKKYDKQIVTDNMVAAHKEVQKTILENAKNAIAQEKPEVQADKQERSKMSLGILLNDKAEKKDEGKKKSKLSAMIEQRHNNEVKKVKEKYGLELGSAK